MIIYFDDATRTKKVKLKRNRQPNIDDPLGNDEYESEAMIEQIDTSNNSNQNNFKSFLSKFKLNKDNDSLVFYKNYISRPQGSISYFFISNPFQFNNKISFLRHQLHSAKTYRYLKINSKIKLRLFH